jgi:hypothetical protein
MLIEGLGLSLLMIVKTLSAFFFGGACSVIAWNRFKNAELSSPELQRPKGLSALTSATCISALGVLGVLLGLGAARGSAAGAVSTALFVCAAVGSFVFVTAGFVSGLRDRTDGSGIVRTGCIVVSVIDLFCVVGMVAILAGVLRG